MLRGERTLLTETGKWDDRTFISSSIHLQSIFNRRKKQKEKRPCMFDEEEKET
jgi:hypothetical protein